VSQKIAGSRPDGVNDLYEFTSSFQPQNGTGVYSAYNRNEYCKQKNNVSGE
jgi:hypothetical protein